MHRVVLNIRTFAVVAAWWMVAVHSQIAWADDGEAGRRSLWADRMAEFERQDAEQPPQPGGVVFVGSSSIRLWDLAASFPELDPPPLNRGFGGSQLIDSIQRAQELVIQYKPRLVVIYAGDNDIAAGKDAERVVADFRRLTNLLHEKLPDAQLAYIAIKPSLARWQLAGTMHEANRQIEAICSDDEQTTFVDIWQPMLGSDGRPRGELFRDDGLHLNDQGYELCASLIAPLLVTEQAEPAAQP